MATGKHKALYQCLNNDCGKDLSWCDKHCKNCGKDKQEWNRYCWQCDALQINTGEMPLNLFGKEQDNGC